MCMPFAMDVTDAASVGASFDQVDAALGVATIVVNNAGSVIRQPSLDVGERDWHGVVDLNQSGVCQLRRPRRVSCCAPASTAA